MREFDQWFHEENRQLEEGYWSPIREGGKQALYAAYRAGMLEAADIAELAKEFILPADDLADLIAKQIREYADED